jgi:hypothetical protein
MAQQIEIEAESLEEAREQLQSQVPEGFELLSERVVSDGKPKTVKGVAETTEAAFTKAASQIPDDAKVLERKEIAPAERHVITVEAPDEQTARSRASSRARGQFKGRATVQSVTLAVAGRRGFLGLGAKPNQYDAEIFTQAVVEIVYKSKAKISAQIDKDDPTKCMICRQDLNLERKVGGIFFGDQLFKLVERTAYKCRNCGAMICMSCARTSRCRKCGGDVFDRAIG